LPAGGVWSVSPYRILAELMRASDDGSYQLCGWETFRTYGFTDQVTNRVYVYNTRLSGDRVIGGHAFTFIKVADSRLGGVEQSTTPDGVEIRMPSLPRALMDAVYDWSRFDTLPAAFHWIRAAARTDPAVIADLADITCRFGNQSTLRRIGFVLTELGLKAARSRKMRAALRSSKSLVPLVPQTTAKGQVDAAWGVIVNE
jgi:predicted transcriptional regulator of viral defense system